jgi:hypothetical protein
MAEVLRGKAYKEKGNEMIVLPSIIIAAIVVITLADDYK